MSLGAATRTTLRAKLAAGARGHDAGDLIALFDGLFRESHHTILVRGDEEPFYQPARIATGSTEYHRIVFAHGYFASALHEVAHWCIAGKRRRALPDYGYWYKPDGRNRAEQAAFEQVEVAPQALEWIFADACGLAFTFSADNLDGQAGDMAAFKEAVARRKQCYLAEGLPPRAARFHAALLTLYQINGADKNNFSGQFKV